MRRFRRPRRSSLREKRNCLRGLLRGGAAALRHRQAPVEEPRAGADEEEVRPEHERRRARGTASGAGDVPLHDGRAAARRRRQSERLVQRRDGRGPPATAARTGPRLWRRGGAPPRRSARAPEPAPQRSRGPVQGGGGGRRGQRRRHRVGAPAPRPHERLPRRGPLQEGGYREVHLRGAPRPRQRAAGEVVVGGELAVHDPLPPDVRMLRPLQPHGRGAGAVLEAPPRVPQRVGGGRAAARGPANGGGQRAVSRRRSAGTQPGAALLRGERAALSEQAPDQAPAGRGSPAALDGEHRRESGRQDEAGRRACGAQLGPTGSSLQAALLCPATQLLSHAALPRLFGPLHWYFLQSLLLSDVFP
mmetsp:Transcript_4717/g.11453  ORF Transcript_4717/g.11453 Transcript_4717/m.11453 type:complete len:361 (+) Transcript_4717:523-1605(+)